MTPEAEAQYRAVPRAGTRSGTRGTQARREAVWMLFRSGHDYGRFTAFNAGKGAVLTADSNG